MCPALFCFRARLDLSLRPDGYRRLAGMAPRGCAREPKRALVVLAPARAQRTLELALLRVAPGWVGVRRDCGALGSDCRHPGVLLARAAVGGSLAHPVLVVGELCGGAQLFGLAAQSAASGIGLTT